MKQDRRWNARLPLSVSVAVYCGGFGLLQCKTSNISLNGIYIKTGRIMLSDDTSVELIFSGQKGRLLTPHRLGAQVMRVTDDGAGLAFHQIETDAYHFLRKLLNTEPLFTHLEHGQAQMHS